MSVWMIGTGNISIKPQVDESLIIEYIQFSKECFPEEYFLTDYLEEIRQTVKFKKWFFGHYHDNRNVNAEEILLWEQIIRIS